MLEVVAGREDVASVDAGCPLGSLSKPLLWGRWAHERPIIVSTAPATTQYLRRWTAPWGLFRALLRGLRTLTHGPKLKSSVSISLRLNKASFGESLERIRSLIPWGTQDSVFRRRGQTARPPPPSPNELFCHARFFGALGWQL